MQQLSQETTDALIAAYRYASKFIDKVETCRARSKETYADMKDLKAKVEKVMEVNEELAR